MHLLSACFFELLMAKVDFWINLSPPTLIWLKPVQRLPPMLIGVKVGNGFANSHGNKPMKGMTPRLFGWHISLLVVISSHSGS